MDFEDIRVYDSLIRETADFVCFLIKHLKIKRVLEIGSGVGYSAIRFSEYCEDVITIEIDKERAEKVKENLNKFNVKNVGLVNGDALEEIGKLNGGFDLIFIDAMKRNYLDYLKLSLNKLNKNALIIADNAVSHKEKMKDFLDYINKNFYTVELNVGRGMSLSVKT